LSFRAIVRARTGGTPSNGSNETMPSKIGREVTMECAVNEAIERVTNALAAEGFGVLTRVDVQATMREKLGKEFREYVILGACNPELAHRALQADAQIGLIMPCNVTVEESGPGRSVVRLGDPHGLMSVGHLATNREVQAIADETARRIDRIERSLATG
jgi:uncharacterized protein (DUF302 family)